MFVFNSQASQFVFKDLYNKILISKQVPTKMNHSSGYTNFEYKINHRPIELKIHVTEFCIYFSLLN